MIEREREKEVTKLVSKYSNSKVMVYSTYKQGLNTGKSSNLEEKEKSRNSAKKDASQVY